MGSNPTTPTIFDGKPEPMAAFPEELLKPLRWWTHEGVLIIEILNFGLFWKALAR